MTVFSFFAVNTLPSYYDNNDLHFITIAKDAITWFKMNTGKVKSGLACRVHFWKYVWPLRILEGSSSTAVE